MAQKWAFLVDPGKCIMCRACVVACKVENHVGAQWQRNDVVLVGPDQSKNPAAYAVFMNCQQCEYPPCVAACPVEGKALEKRGDGIVLFKRDKCVGAQMCVVACPYGVIKLTPVKSKYGYFQSDKCTFCAHKLDRPADSPGGNRPACAMSCPTNAIEFGEREKLLAKVKEMGREVLDLDVMEVGPSNIFLKPVPVRRELGGGEGTP